MCLLDVRLPCITGAALLARLRRRPLSSQLPSFLVIPVVSSARFVNVLSFSQTLIMYAAKYGRERTVMKLYARGADPTIVNARGMVTRSMRHFVRLTSCGLPPSFRLRLKRLLIRRVLLCATIVQTCLMFAARVSHHKVVEFLLQVRQGKLLNVNAVDDLNRSALAFALRGGGDRAARALMAAGANVNLATADGTTPLVRSIVRFLHPCSR